MLASSHARLFCCSPSDVEGYAEEEVKCLEIASQCTKDAAGVPLASCGVSRVLELTGKHT